jgi:hypothetical protein
MMQDTQDNRESRVMKVARTLIAVGFLPLLLLGGCGVDPADMDNPEEVDIEPGAATEEEALHIKVESVKIDVQSVYCNSGWPGSRGCSTVIRSPTDIIPDSIIVEVDGRNGSMARNASMIGSRMISFTASIREADMFYPGKNNTRFIVGWLRRK